MHPPTPSSPPAPLSPFLSLQVQQLLGGSPSDGDDDGDDVRVSNSTFGRPSFGQEQATAVKEAVSSDVTDAALSHTQDVIAHLRNAVAAALSAMKEACDTKELPVMNTGDLEVWLQQQGRSSKSVFLDCSSKALELAAAEAPSGGEKSADAVAAFESWEAKKAQETLMNDGVELEAKNIRNRNKDLIRKQAPPDAPNIAKLLAGDGVADVVAIVPQPNLNFSTPVCI